MTVPLGLPAGVRACLFDLDGVITQTAAVHEAAWKKTFDAFLRGYAQRSATPFVPFEHGDYDEYVDGKPRLAGTRDFLASRGITLPEGGPGDPPDAATVHGLSNAKNELVQAEIEAGGVVVFEGSVRYLRQVRTAGLRTAVVSSSANTVAVLRSVGLLDCFDARVDGLVAAERGLAGKPAPDTFLAAARELGVAPSAAAVFEDALAGVAAGRAGGFGFVVGVDRAGQREALKAHGADVVVDDLAELLGSSAT